MDKAIINYFASTPRGEALNFDNLLKALPGITVRAGIVLVAMKGRAPPRILAVTDRHSKNVGFPKGIAESTDTSAEITALRELSEETGVVLRRPKVENTFVYFHNRYQELFIYLLVVVAGQPSVKAGPEIHTTEWLTLDELKEKKLSIPTRRVVSVLATYLRAARPPVSPRAA